MNNETPVEAVIFDMDGLLIDSETLAMECLATAGVELGFDMPMRLCRMMIGVPADRCREIVLRTFGAEFPVTEYFELHESHLRHVVESGRLRTKPGATALLDSLDRQAIPKAIVTSSSKARVDHCLRMVGIDDRFDLVVSREDVRYGKPHPESYCRAVDSLGGEREKTLAMEDSPAGLQAACAAGIRCILIPDLIEPDDNSRRIAHRIFQDLFEAAAYITAANKS